MSNVIQGNFKFKNPGAGKSPENKQSPGIAEVRIPENSPLRSTDPMQEVFETLHFYANQGFDHGHRARLALVPFLPQKA